MSDREIPSPGELARHAYRKIEAEREALFRIGAIPVALQFLIAVLIGPLSQSDPMLLVVAALNMIPVTLFDVAWLRHLLRAAGGDPPLPYRWTRRHTGFAARLAALYILMIIAAIPASFVAAIFPLTVIALLAFLLGVVFFYAFLRFSLFFTARAFDQEISLQQSWAATRDGAGRFFWGAAFSFLPGFIVLMIVFSIAKGTGFAAAFPLVTTLAASAVYYLCNALLLAVIARVYEIRVTGFREAEF